MSITINVTAKAGEGKSTVAQLIAAALGEVGINVLIKDEDTIESVMKENQAARIQALAKKLNGEPIIISQTQAPRK